MTDPIQAVIFDWAGTMVDFGSRAPVVAMMRVLEGEGTPVDEALVRRYMGMAKREHIIQILEDPAVSDAWRAAHSAEWSERDIDRIMDNLEPIMTEAATDLADLIPGASDTFEYLRSREIKIGSSTGYTTSMMAGIRSKAAAQGYTPDSVYCASDTPRGRPAPYLIWKNLIELDVEDVEAVVKVDDAPVGIMAGRVAGCWTVGVAGSGNQMGLSHTEYSQLSGEEKQTQLKTAADSLQEKGAHFVVESVAQFPKIFERINALANDGIGPKDYRGEPLLLAELTS